MNRSKNDTVLIGLAIGAIFPILAYFVVEQIFVWLTQARLVADVEGLGMDRRDRTTYLFSLVAAVIPIQILSNKKMDQTMRGFMLAIAIYICGWLWKYGSYLLAHF